MIIFANKGVITWKHLKDIKGFSDKNLWRMKQFYETYAEDAEKLSAVLRQISWTNNLTILTRCKSTSERAFYLQMCINEHLSTRQLDRQIDSAFYGRTQVSQPKLSPLVREIAPEAERVFRDQYVMGLSPERKQNQKTVFDVHSWRWWSNSFSNLARISSV